MIDNNIIKSLGAGSGIDTKNMVQQLTEIERSAPQKRIDNKREMAESQISDFGALASAMNTLKASISALSAPEGMYSKNATFSESDALVPTKLDTDVQPGTYSLEVQSVAQSQSLTFAGLADPKSAVGEGEITFNFGQWDRDGSDVPTAFNADPDAEPFTITIDSSNNTLEGLRDAINKADMGVQATIINDGSSYRLSIAAPSGASNELNISVVEPDAGDNTDASGLSRFAFNADVTSFADLETQAGADALIKVNGLLVARETNTVDDVVEGLTLDLLQAAPGETATITISDDKAFAEEKVRSFVDAYNTFLEETETLFGWDEEEEKYGSLANDPLAKSVVSRFRGLIASEIPGLADSDMTSLTNVGIRTELDGTLSINEKDMTSAFADHFEDVQKLFAPTTYSSASEISVNSFGKNTQAGEYDVVITQAPKKGSFSGTAVDAGVTFPGFDTSGKSYTLSLTVNGIDTAEISIPTDTTYDSVDDLAAAIETAINGDSALAANGTSVTVSYDTDTNAFVLTSSKYGANSKVSITAASADLTTDLGLAVGAGSAGIDVAGTVNGVAGFGLGNVLLPKLGEDAEGLSLIVGENADTGTVNFSRGFAGRMEEVLNGFLQRNGLFDQREDVLEREIQSLDDDEEQLDRRIGAYEERLTRQFIAMESILNSLNSQGGFLENLIDTLPFTAKK